MRGTETGGPGGKVGLVRVPSTSEGPTAALAGPEHSEKIPSDPVWMNFTGIRVTYLQTQLAFSMFI